MVDDCGTTMRARAYVPGIKEICQDALGLPELPPLCMGCMASSMGSRPSSQRGNTMGSSANSQRSGNAIRLSDVHDSLHSSTSTCHIKPWGREI